MSTRPSRQPKTARPAAGLEPRQHPLAGAGEAFREALARWYAREKRPLPWRTEISLYRTIVSEFMCQQTQIRTVLPYFERWMQEFPDFAALAAAPESRVLKAWEGLGYYARARRLHALAKEVRARAGELPDTAAGWLDFSGIGPYTAAAIASITFGSPDACVDGNVVRILARLTADARPLGAGSEAAKRFQPLADALLDRAAPGDHNQAMMELGATVCTKASPACTVCPVVEFCAGARAGSPEKLPVLARQAAEERAVTKLWIHGARGVLLRFGVEGARFHGVAELPEPADLALPEGWEERARPAGTIRRSITRFRIVETVLELPAALLPEKIPAALRWISLSELAGTALSGPHRRWLDARLRAGRTGA